MTAASPFAADAVQPVQEGAAAAAAGRRRGAAEVLRLRLDQAHVKAGLLDGDAHRTAAAQRACASKLEHLQAMSSACITVTKSLCCETCRPGTLGLILVCEVGGLMPVSSTVRETENRTSCELSVCPCRQSRTRSRGGVGTLSSAARVSLDIHIILLRHPCHVEL